VFGIYKELLDFGVGWGFGLIKTALNHHFINLMNFTKR
jgi:hypothetical protein